MKALIFLSLLSTCSIIVARDLAIVDFGGVGDRKTDCTTAFAKAVDAAYAAGADA